MRRPSGSFGSGVGEGGFVGVDVFYVISGFLITGLLVREVDKRGLDLASGVLRAPCAPAASCGRAGHRLRTRRVASSCSAPRERRSRPATRWPLPSTTLNWRFVAQSADYFGPQTGQSPLQHYWSLSIEEQFYLVWPLILLGLVVLWRRRGKPMPRAAAAGAIGAITAASLTYSILYEPTSSGEAYFSSFTRAWELGLGGLLVFLPVSRLGRSPAWPSGSPGIGAILLATFTFDASTRFPGVAALLPCLGAAAIIRAGRPDMPFRPLTLRPVRYIGRISYSLYLWHWPPLVFVAAEVGELSGARGRGAHPGLVHPGDPHPSFRRTADPPLRAG